MGTHRHLSGTRLLAAAALAVVAGACGGSDDAGGNDASGGDFCDQLNEVIESGDTDEDLGAAAEKFAALGDDAPDEVREALEVISDALSELSDLDEDDPESFSLIFDVIGRDDVVEATEDVERYGVEECGLEPTSDADVEG